MSSTTIQAPPPKPGVKSTEFWITLIAQVLGAVLIALGHEEAGAAVVAFATGLYSHSRGQAKRTAG